MSKHSVLIIYPDKYLAYSPTTLNLYDQLSNSFDVSIITFLPDAMYSDHRFNNKKIEYIYIKENATGINLIKRLGKEVKKTINSRLKPASDLLTRKATLLISRIKDFKGAIIAVDFFALWCVQQAGKQAHLLSLEIYEHDKYRDACNFTLIKSVIIQSQERYTYLFKDIKLTAFFIQNAPAYIELDLNKSKPAEFRNSVVLCGSAVPEFGVYSCIEFIQDYPEYMLTIKGAIPPKVRKKIEDNFRFLIDSKHLVLDDEYISPNELNQYLSKFFIGFVFYDFLRFDFINSFNYKTAPSGKLFQYFNAGVPVICNQIDGLSSVQEFTAGLMINSLGSSSIKHAIDEINLNYDSYVNGAKKASLHFDFKNAVVPFENYLRHDLVN